MSSTKRSVPVQLMVLIFSLISLTFFACGALIAFSYPLGNVAIEGIDTTIFTPQISILTRLCLWIPALIMGVAATVVWFSLGRTPLQHDLTHSQDELERLRQHILQTYLDQIGALLAEKQVHDIAPIIQQRTKETVAVLDGMGKRKLLQFLYEAHLIRGPEAISLAGVNLRGALLQGLDMSEANLLGANLSGADLSGTKLARAHITADQLAHVKSSTGAILPEDIL